MADLQALADEFHSAYMRELAATDGLSADAMLIARIAADSEAAGQRLRDAAEQELGFNAALALWSANAARASHDYFQLSDAEQKQLLLEDSAIASARKPEQHSMRASTAPARNTGAQTPSSPIALTTAIIQNARPHPITWGVGHPRYDRFTYLPNGNRDLPNDAPSAFYDANAGKFTERDHLVGLAQAHESGAAYWSSETRQAFALDPDNIYSITPATNTEKSYRDPADWLPADPSVHKRYAAEWVLIKTRWSLTYDEAELAALRRILDAETNS